MDPSHYEMDQYAVPPERTQLKAKRHLFDINSKCSGGIVYFAPPLSSMFVFTYLPHTHRFVTTELSESYVFIKISICIQKTSLCLHVHEMGI